MKNILVGFVLLVAASTSSAQVTGTWRSNLSSPNPLPNAPETMCGNSAGTIGGAVYFFGGWVSGQGYTRRTFRYDPTTNAMSEPSVAQMPARWETGSASLNNKIYMFAGCNFPGDTPGNDMFEFDAITGWSSTALPGRLNVNRVAPSCVVMNGKIYAIGGRTGWNSGTFLSTAEEFDSATGTWTPIAALPNALGFTIAAAVNGTIHIAGGYTTSNTVMTSAAYTWTPGAASWTAIESMPSAKAGGVGMASGNRFVCLGGNGAMRSGWYYNPVAPAGSRWVTTLATADYDVSNGASVQIGTSVYMLGYGANSFTGSANLQQFTLPPPGLVPAAPLGLQQEGVLPGAVTGGDKITFRADVTDPDAADRVGLEVEVRKDFNPFTGSGNATGILGAQGTCTVDYVDFDDTLFSSYKWRARSIDENGNASAWIDYGAADPDFTWDQEAPPASVITTPAAYGDVIVPSTVSGVVTFECRGVTDGSGMAVTYEFVVKDFTGAVVATMTSSAPTADATLMTSKEYYTVEITTVDVFDNTAPTSAVSRFRVVYDDGVNNGAGDAIKACGFSATSSSWIGALAILALLAVRRRQ